MFENDFNSSFDSAPGKRVKIKNGFGEGNKPLISDEWEQIVLKLSSF